MGLTEKRLAEEIKKNQLPAFQQKINEIVGTPISINLDWDSFCAYDAQPLEWLDQCIFKHMGEAFEEVCTDEIGKDAVKQSISNIIIKCTDNIDLQKFELSQKTLLYEVKLAGTTTGYWEASDLKKKIENLL